MAEIAKSGTPSIASHGHVPADYIGGLLAGEAIGDGDACYIKGSDNRIYKSTGAAANAAAKVDGYAGRAADAGEAVTLFAAPCTFAYGTGLTPGARVYLSGTVPGGLADAASTGGVSPLGHVVDATRIRLHPSMY